MHDPFVADAGPDPAVRAVEIARAHHAFLTGGRRAASGVRDIVLESWARSMNAHVDPDGEAPVTLLDADLEGYREAHPLATVLPILRELVGRAAVDSHHIMAVTDSSGLILWAEGHAAALALGERIHLVEGAAWNERDAGTNAMGTALAVDEAVHIFSAEHFRHPVQTWTCAAAPIHDPATGRLLGTIDVTGGSTIAHPHSMALVRAAARAAEAELAWHRIDPAHLWLPGPHRSVRLEALNRSEGVLHLDGERVRLGRRLTEILILLHSRPEGLNGEQLADALYDGQANPTTVRVELNRLRRVVGDLVQSRPYRLTARIDADFDDVTAALVRDDVVGAVAAYAGPLLPSSEARAVVELRHRLDTRLRNAVLVSDDWDALDGWLAGSGIDDLEVWERLVSLLPAGSARHGHAVTQLNRLRTEYGLPALSATLMQRRPD